MKLTRIIPVVAIATLAMLASCKSGNKTDAAATEGAANTEATTAAPAKSADEIALEKATTLKGWIKAIAGDVVTIVDANGNETQVKVVNAYDELIEGAPIEVKYIDDNGTKKTATGDNKSLALSQNYKKLLGKWATEGDKITFELRKSGKMKSTMKGTDFRAWKVLDDKTIEFTIANDKGEIKSPWEVETLDDNNLVLKNGESKIPMTRKDSNRE
ncbi:MAG: hypothetical protein J6T96_15875 [Bacteroidales bacterium]|nr:hypothetical protein [Bacteroidales bacterium]MBO7565762.1 hypothetical protein [Bacteroidales bacterium]